MMLTKKTLIGNGIKGTFEMLTSILQNQSLLNVPKRNRLTLQVTLHLYKGWEVLQSIRTNGYQRDTDQDILLLRLNKCSDQIYYQSNSQPGVTSEPQRLRVLKGHLLEHGLGSQHGAVDLQDLLLLDEVLSPHLQDVVLQGTTHRAEVVQAAHAWPHTIRFFSLQHGTCSITFSSCSTFRYCTLLFHMT